jgi:hypothetical protein
LIAHLATDVILIVPTHEPAPPSELLVSAPATNGDPVLPPSDPPPAPSNDHVALAGPNLAPGRGLDLAPLRLGDPQPTPGSPPLPARLGDPQPEVDDGFYAAKNYAAQAINNAGAPELYRLSSSAEALVTPEVNLPAPEQAPAAALGQQNAPAPAPAEANAPAPVVEHTPPIEYANGQHVRPLADYYAGEQQDASRFRGAPQSWQPLIDFDRTLEARERQIPIDQVPASPQVSSVSTRYMGEREQHYREIEVQQGRLMQNGSAYDTSAATGLGTQLASGGGKHIFSMTPEGTMRGVDPWAAKHVTPKPDGSSNLAFVNHSSLVAGGAVASAGELTVRNGQLQQISDASGHYKTTGTMMRQALEQFGEQGVHTGVSSLDGRETDGPGVDIRFAAKSQNPDDPMSKPVIGSAQEFMSYANPDTAEKGMRDHRAAMRNEITTAHAARTARWDQAALDFGPQMTMDLLQFGERPASGVGRVTNRPATVPYDRTRATPGYQAPARANAAPPAPVQNQPPALERRSSAGSYTSYAAADPELLAQSMANIGSND